VIITCPKCFSAHDVLPPRRLPDNLLQYRCTMFGSRTYTASSVRLGDWNEW
jgi:hypothetical protein